MLWHNLPSTPRPHHSALHTRRHSTPLLQVVVVCIPPSSKTEGAAESLARQKASANALTAALVAAGVRAIHDESPNTCVQAAMGQPLWSYNCL